MGSNRRKPSHCAATSDDDPFLSYPAGRLAPCPTPATTPAFFAPATRAWLEGAFSAPTPAQVGAWTAIGRGEHTLVVAPTGSGKTLAAFLSALDRLAREPKPEDPRRRCRVLYVSPLKALAVDVERNLRSPLAGIRQASVRLGLPAPDITVATRSGDNPRRRNAGCSRGRPRTS